MCFVLLCVFCVCMCLCLCVCVCLYVCMCVCLYVLLLLPDRNKQPVTTAFTSRTPIGSRDPFSPYLGKLGSPFYIRYSSRKNFQSLILELDKEKVEKCYREKIEL